MAAASAAIALLAGSAQAQGVKDVKDVTLPNGVTLHIQGAAAGDAAGYSVARAGDVNHDGLADVIIGAPAAHSGAGAAYVIYGTKAAGTVDLANLGAAGFEIDGAVPGDAAGTAVSAAGDVNGDGIDDVIVGAPKANGGLAGLTRQGAGAAYVIYGEDTADVPDVNLATLSTSAGDKRGFIIGGGAAGDALGTSVGAAGDANGDGVDDVIVGSPGANNGAGSAYVVDGNKTADLKDVDAGSFGGRGFRIDGAAAGDAAGFSVDGAGDVNGDGVGDVVVGSPDATAKGRAKAGSASVVYGRTASGAVDLSKLGSDGFTALGAAAGDQAGYAVSGAGDVNADGVPDVIVGAPGAGANAGAAFVLYGSKQADLPDVDLVTIQAGGAQHRGFVATGAHPGDRAGFAVDSAGDVNGDGTADVVVGAPGDVTNATTFRGNAYVLYGRPTTDLANVQLADIVGTADARGFRIQGASDGDHSGTSVAGVGDVNGDGVADVIVGSPGDDTSAGANAGSASVIAGGQLKPQATCDGHPATIVGTPGNDTITGTSGDDVIYAGAGDDRVDGHGGNDIVCGGAGNDSLSGGAGDDHLYGQAGNDAARGNAGQDTMLGGIGDDRFNGGHGDDAISGESGNDTLRGGPGDDLLKGNTGQDLLKGGSGDDQLRGGHDDDRLAGQGGIDRLLGGPGNDDANGNSGNDVVRGNSGDDRLHGGHGDDHIGGGPGNDTIDGASGYDVADGNRGLDVIRGEGGDDDLRGGVDHDRILGENGNDRLRGNQGPDLLDGGPGRDYVSGGHDVDTCLGGPGSNQLRSCEL